MMLGCKLNRIRRTSKAVLLAFGVVALGACADTDSAAQDEPADTEATEDATTDASEPEAIAWSYSGDTGPEQWATLSDEYAVCASGSEQSPINIQSAELQSADLPPLEFAYGSVSLRVEDAVYGMYAAPETGQELTIAGETYSLLQFHGHAPSEHTIDGDGYPLEIHFVHSNSAGELAVVGVMVEEGERASAYTPIADAMVVSDGAEEATADVALRDLLPEDLDYVTYEGSLTTPPCTEGVRWIVLTTPVELGAEQIDVLAGDQGATNRPTQPLAGRAVRSSS